MEMNGSELLVRLLIEQGVDTVFGYPGGAVLNIYDALYAHRAEIRHVLTSHEQGAAHAADGYARASGRVGVCIATSGPGATNLVTGIATAMLDSVPLVAITGNVASALLGKDSFQEVDIYGITMPITKHNFMVKDVKDLSRCVREAFRIARAGRPGPVLVDIAKDVTQAKAVYHHPEKPAGEPERRGPSEKELAEALKLIEASERPFIYAGGGVTRSGAEAELKAFAELVRAPLATSLMGISSFPSAHPLSTGMLGMHGSRASNVLITESDLVIAVGARFSDRVTGKKDRFAPGAKILHIDIDPAEINKNVRSHRQLSGDAKRCLASLNERLSRAERPEWMARLAALKAEAPIYPEGGEGGLSPASAVRLMREAAGPEALVVTDVGQHQMWVGQCWDFERPRSFLSSGGMGTMGYSMGAAIGAQTAALSIEGLKGRPVVAFVGDGGFRMNMNELATIARYGLPICIVLMNNGVLGMVRQWQRFFYGERYSETELDRPPDFMKLAEAFGIAGRRASSGPEFAQAAKEAIGSGKPYLIEARIDRDALVLPMVAPGSPIDEQMLRGPHV
jgi:acetolactate synthase-1/2/3 large subunit